MGHGRPLVREAPTWTVADHFHASKSYWRPPGSSPPSWLTDVLDAAGSDAYREGDLGRAARIWGIVAAATDEPYVRERIVSLLSMTQRADGTFGYFGPEEQVLSGSEGAPQHPWRWVQVDVARTLNLVATSSQPPAAIEAASNATVRSPRAVRIHAERHSITPVP